MAIPLPDTYSTQEVLALTGISRYSLQRYLKQQRFPKPVNKSTGSGSANYFSKQEVDAWIAARANHLPVNTEALNADVQETLTFTKREMSQHRRACAELQCSFEAYALDAIRWKTHTVLPDSYEMRRTRRFPQLRDAS